MSGHHKEWFFRIEDMLGAIGEIQNSISDHDNALSFYEDLESFRAVERNIQIIAEASKHIPEGIKAQYADIQWREIINMRNLVVHEYKNVDYEVVWLVVSDKIPIFEEALRFILKDHQ